MVGVAVVQLLSQVHPLWPHGLQYARFPCLSVSPRVCSNLSWWCHPTISSSVAHFSSCPQSFPASGSFPTSPLVTAGGQSIGASASVLPVNIQGWFPVGLTCLILLLSKELSIWKHQFFGAQPSSWSNSHICIWLLEKTTALTIGTFVDKMMSLLFNMLSMCIITFLPRNKHLLISWV